MQRRFPTLHLVGRSPLAWQGDIEPSESGRAFTLHVEIRGGRAPRVLVLSPKLENDPQTGRPPHTFGDRSLCLYHVSEFIWTGKESVASTIVPWACEWCWYYEHWEETGRWLGPEFEHTAPKRRDTRFDDDRASRRSAA